MTIYLNWYDGSSSIYILNSIFVELDIRIRNIKKINKMLEVSASEIVTADKMRGVGPANIIFTAGPNPVAEDRRGVAKVTAGGESKNVTSCRRAGRCNS